MLGRALLLVLLVATPALGQTTQPSPPAMPDSVRGYVRDAMAGRIAVVRVLGHAGPNRASYVDSLHAQIVAFDSAGACGWIVDLRDNTGGNMWPMLAGVGPLLGAEVVGSFTSGSPDARWRYRDGRSWIGDSTPPPMAAGWGSAVPRPLTDLEAPVALLTGRRTASSGEMTLMAFLGRPSLRTFGDSTAGFNSANVAVPLRDGARMVITSAYPRDRLGRAYPLRVGPDELIPERPADGDRALERAAAWLRGQPACSGG